MSCRIFIASKTGGDAKPGSACLFDSVTGLVFGPIFESWEDAQDFTNYCEAVCGDPRTLSAAELADVVADWRRSVLKREGNP